MTGQSQHPFSTSGLLSDTFQHFGQLVKSEIALAKAEIAERISSKAMGGVWMMIGAVMALFALGMALEAAVFAIASTGIALYWSCLIVAGGLIVVSLAFFLYGRASMQASLTPRRSISQLNRDVATAREQMQ
jgi:hypothetical protein